MGVMGKGQLDQMKGIYAFEEGKQVVKGKSGEFREDVQQVKGPGVKTSEDKQRYGQH